MIGLFGKGHLSFMPKIVEFKTLVTSDMEISFANDTIPDPLYKALCGLNMEVLYYDKNKCPFGAYKNYPGVHFIAPSHERPIHHQIWIDRHNVYWKDTLLHEIAHAVISEFKLPHFGWHHNVDPHIDEQNELIVSDLCDMLQDIWVEHYLEQIDINRECHKLLTGRILIERTCIFKETNVGHSTSDVVSLCKMYVNARIQLGETQFRLTSLGQMYHITDNRFVGKPLNQIQSELDILERQLNQPSNSSKLQSTIWELLVYIYQHKTIEETFDIIASPYINIKRKALQTYQCVMKEFKYDVPTYAEVVPKIASILSVTDIIEFHSI